MSAQGRAWAARNQDSRSCEFILFLFRKAKVVMKKNEFCPEGTIDELPLAIANG